jgi:hypothetical protein
LSGRTGKRPKNEPQQPVTDAAQWRNGEKCHQGSNGLNVDQAVGSP